jgi:hypothetical protein
MSTVISVPASIVVIVMMEIAMWIVCKSTALGAGLCREYIGASPRFDDLVLVGFSMGSGSPDIGARVPAVAPGKRRRRSVVE